MGSAFSGSCNHRLEAMVKAFEIARHREQDVVERFGGMYRAVQYGGPAAWRHGRGPRPHRDAALRHREPARDLAISDEPAGGRFADLRAVRCHAEAAARTAHQAE